MDMDEKDRYDVIKFLADTDQFFLNIMMATGKAVMDAARQITDGTIVTAMCRNGVEFGIRISGMGDEWFTAPRVLFPVFVLFSLLLLVPCEIFIPPCLPFCMFPKWTGPDNGLCQKYSRRKRKSLWALLTIYYDSRTSCPTVHGFRKTHSCQ